MIIDQLERLATWDIVLASGSPRRAQIFTHNMGLANTRFVVSSFDEKSLNKSSFSHPSHYVKENSKQKALDVMQKLRKENHIPDLLVSADTIVSLQNTILEKPVDEEDARHMLQSLSGREHVVYTGVCFFINNVPEPVTFVEKTMVEFGELNDRLIDAYIATGEPFDKAGGYGIQDKGAMFVKSIKGCYFNVMGFPLYRFCKELAERLENKAS